MREPKYLEQGVEQLHSSKYIKDKIIDFESYSYYKNKLPENPKDRAVFEIEVNNDNLRLYLTCNMKKIGDDWKLIVIKQDSVAKIQHKQ